MKHATFVLLLLALVLAGCGGNTPNRGRSLNPGTGTPSVIVAGETFPSPTPLGTLPPIPSATPPATHDPRTPLPDAAAFTRLIYTYTAGLKPVPIVLDLAPDGSARGRFGTIPRAGVVGPEKMNEIRAALLGSSFFALDDRYVPVRQCCDLPSHEITLILPDGSAKTIYIVGSAPESLQPLTRALSGVVKSLPPVQ